MENNTFYIETTYLSFQMEVYNRIAASFEIRIEYIILGSVIWIVLCLGLWLGLVLALVLGLGLGSIRVRVRVKKTICIFEKFLLSLSFTFLSNIGMAVFNRFDVSFCKKE